MARKTLQNLSLNLQKKGHNKSFDHEDFGAGIAQTCEVPTLQCMLKDHGLLGNMQDFQQQRRAIHFTEEI